MRRAVPLLAVLCVLTFVATLCGCGGSTGPPPAEETGATKIPDGYGCIKVTINWPSHDSPSRKIMTACLSIKVIVTGGGIATPIEQVVNYPTTTASLIVPAGSGRVVDAQGFDAADAGGSQIQKTYATFSVPEVVTGGTYSATVYLGDMWDPTDDAYGGASVVTTDGTKTGWHVLDRTYAAQSRDVAEWFKFTATAGTWYTIETWDLAGTVTGSGYYFLAVFGTNGSTELARSGNHGLEHAVLTWQAPADGVYFAFMQAYPAGTGTAVRIEYRLTINGSGSGTIGSTID